mgnify:CR=1 FL=1
MLVRADLSPADEIDTLVDPRAAGAGSVILALDPGADGALAWLTTSGELLHVEDMPSIEVKVGKTKRRRVSGALLVDLLRTRGPVAHAFVERVGAMPGQGTASMFAFGYAAGLIEGALAGCGIPMTFVAPQTWKASLRLPPDKGAARMRACQVWPRLAAKFARVKDDGRAEAALIGLHGVHTLRQAGVAVRAR